MNKRISENPRSMFSKFFITSMIAFVVTACALAVSLYMSFYNIVLDSIYTAEKNSISQISFSANVMTDMAATFATQMYSDPDIYALLRRSTLSANNIIEACEKLRDFRNSSSSYFFSFNLCL